MEAFFDYLLKSTVWLSAFAVFYFFLLRNERYFLLNRIFLISGLLAALFFPFITFSYEVTVSTLTANVTGDNLQSEIVSMEESGKYGLLTILSILLAGGAAFRLGRLVYQTTKVIRIIHRSDITYLHSAKVIITNDILSSFTFFSHVLANPSVSETELKEIIVHEKEHIGQYHWIDLVLCELLRILQWFNPFVWLYGKFIRQNHEYLADRAALKQTEDPSIYKAVLLNQLLCGEVISFAHSINYSLNKKRFAMMKNSHTPFIKRLKVIFMIPVMGVIFYACATPEYKEENSSEVPEQSISPKENSSETASASKTKEIEEQPTFPGGQEALMSYLGSKMIYPIDAIENSVQGRLMVQFTVSAEGKVADVVVVRELYPSIDAEAIRIVKAMPDWIPGKDKGKNVSARVTLPIAFMLR